MRRRGGASLPVVGSVSDKKPSVRGERGTSAPRLTPQTGSSRESKRGVHFDDGRRETPVGEWPLSFRGESLMRTTRFGMLALVASLSAAAVACGGDDTSGNGSGGSGGGSGGSGGATTTTT